MKQDSVKAKSANTRKAKVGNSKAEQKTSRMPSDSVLFEKVVPAALIFLGLLTLGLIVFAIAVLLGLVTY